MSDPSVLKRFNTTLVQLKAPAISASIPLAPGFNTTLVQLKGAGAQRAGAAGPQRFQYHTGPIKSYTFQLFERTRTGFNTTLVQLKVSLPTPHPARR